MSASEKKQLALVLSGGGARGAYQAGVIRALEEIHREINIPFANTIAGVSAGAINAGFLAARLDQPELAATNLFNTWNKLQAEEVFRTDYASVTRNALKAMRGFSLGGLAGNSRNPKVGLFNTAPLEELIKSRIDFSRIQKNIDAGILKGVAVSATDYTTAFGVTFVQSQPGQKMWTSANRFSVKAELSAKHVMASSAIPIFFPPGEVASRYYGDGCLRNTAPLSPAVHMGADKILVVGVRNEKHLEDYHKPSYAPSMGRLFSVLINAIFMDSIDVDLERLRIVNESIEKFNLTREGPGYKTISTLYLYPSKDLAQIAQSHWNNLPAIIRILFNGLGTAEESADLLSYLLFDPQYCSALTTLGYDDTRRRRDEIIEFLQK